MADQTNFKHIKVTQSDDDVVIVAGVPHAPAAPEPTVVEDEVAVAADLPDEAAVEEQVAPEPEPEPQAAAPQPSAGAEDGYRGTTLEDIDSSKMPTAQKIVVALAVAAVVAFIAWYVMAGS